MKSWLVRRWKLVINILTLFILVLLIFFTRHQIVSTLSDLGHVNAVLLILLIPIEILNYHAQTKIYKGLFKIVGNNLSYKFLYRASLELNFVNHVFPSGGLTGISYFSLRLRQGKNLGSGKVTMIHLIKIIMYVLSFEIILIFGAFSLAIMGRVNELVVLVVGALSMLIVLMTLGFIFVAGNRSRIDVFMTWLAKTINQLIHFLRPSSSNEVINISQLKKLFEDFHDTYETLKSNLSEIKQPFLYSFLADLTEVAAVYVVYMAFGQYVNVGAIIIAYGIANFAGLVSVLPGNIGIYEGIMTVVLAITGIPPGVSLPITIMYRVLNTLIQVPPGYLLYHLALRKGQVNQEDLMHGV